MKKSLESRVSCILNMSILIISLTIISAQSYAFAIEFYSSEALFMSVAPIMTTETFDTIPPDQRDGFFPAYFKDVVYVGEGNIGHTTWAISTPPYQPFGIPTSSAVLYSPAVGEDFFSFGSNRSVEAFGFDLFHPYDEQTVGGIINIGVSEIDGNVSTFAHNQDGQWLYFGFISDVGISQIRVYNSTNDNVLDTNFAFDNISRSEILCISNPLTHCVSTPEELESALTEAGNNCRDDIIQIVQGTYYGNFVCNSTEANSLAIKGGYTEDCADRVVAPLNTALNGQGNGAVLVLTAPDVKADFLINGLSIQDGNTVGVRGGGLVVGTDGGNVTVSNTIVSNNTATHAGGGLYISEASSIILTNNDISGNSSISSNGIATAGGGLAIFSEKLSTAILTENIITGNTGSGAWIRKVESPIIGTVTLSNNVINNNFCGSSSLSCDGTGVQITAEIVTLHANTISNNDHQTSGIGGGADIWSLGGRVEVTENTISNNSCDAGGGIHVGVQGSILEGGSFVFANNVITGNYARTRGGGVLAGGLSEYVEVTLTNNTICYNSADDEGGGLNVYLEKDTASAYIYNNIIIGNSATEGADLALRNDLNGNGTASPVELFNNDFDQTEATGTYIQDPSSVNSGDNLDNINPLFVDPIGDYHLTSGSPCQDAGSEVAPQLPDYDFEGDPRTCGPAPDIGADEVACFDSDSDGIPDDYDMCVYSNLSPTVVIDGCDSGVPNILFLGGCTISDKIAELASNSTNHGKFVSAVAHYTNDLKKDGVISGKQKGVIQRCAAQADIP